MRRRLGIPAIRTIGVLAVYALFCAVSLWFQEGSFLERYESMPQLLVYLADRPLAARIFDIELTNLGVYQARELGYLFDYFDASFILASMRAGMFHFTSLTHYACLLVISLIAAFLRERHLTALSYGNFLLLLSLYLVAPPNFFAPYFRASKILTAALLLLLIVLAYFQDPRRRETGRAAIVGWAGCAAVATALSLVDRQGFAAVVVLAALSAILTLSGMREQRGVALTLVAAALVNTVYNVVLGPWLIEMTNGYAPSLEYQNLSFLSTAIAGTLEEHGRLQPLWWSLLLLPENVSLFFGSSGFVAGSVLMSLACFALWRIGSLKSSDTSRVARQRPVLIYVAALLAVSALNWILVSRAGLLLWEESTIIYYPIPAMLLILLGTMLVLHLALAEWPALRRPASAGLIVALLLSLHALPARRESVFFPGTSWSGYEYADDLFGCLESGDPENLPNRERAFCRAMRRKMGFDVPGSSIPGVREYDRAERIRIGDGEEKDEKRAVARYLVAAERGYVLAQVEMARRYAVGDGTKKSPARARRWLRAAAQQGHAQAALDLVLAVEEKHPGREFKEAESLLRVAAEGGLDHACVELGKRYSEGRGVPRDLAEAHVWFSLVSPHLRPFVVGALQKLESKLTAEELSIARARASELRRSRTQARRS